jgi:ribokinase
MNSPARGGRVQVVGAINVDLVVVTPRLPAPGETVVGPRMDRYGGGKGANAAVAAARAGAQVELIGAVGSDDNGRSALAELRADGVDIGSVSVSAESPTGVALIVVDGAGENQIAVGSGANAEVDATLVDEAITKRSPPSDCVLVSTEIPGDAVVAAVRAAEAAGVRCIVNPAPPIPELAKVLRHHPILTPNAGECHALAALSGKDADTVREAADALMQTTGAPVIVTLGSGGVLVGTPADGFEHLDADPAVVRDTTGAGDTFNGVFAAQLAAGATLMEAARTANSAAARSVSYVGARAGM